MLKYESSLVTFTEIPDEVTLCINITGCPCHCENCFEPWLQEDKGENLTTSVLDDLITQHNGITCVCFMGGDRSHLDILQLARHIKQNYSRLKVAMYSGFSLIDINLSLALDYYKIGPFMPKYGPLNHETTNQRLYKIANSQMTDITYKFQKERK